MNVRHFPKVVGALFLIISTAGVAEGLYVGASIGGIGVKDSGSGYSIDDIPFGSRVFIGIQPGEVLAFEAAYYGSETAKNADGLSMTEADINSIAIYALGIASSGDRGRFFGKLGLFQANREITSEIRNIDDTEGGFAFGLGFFFDLNKQLSVRGDFDLFKSDIDQYTSATIGFQFSFGN